MFYGQFGEDRYLSQFFDSSYKGRCIDVGAYDGVNGSNTYYFENNGWDCLCVEPVPESFHACNAVRKRTLNCCVSNYDKEDAFFHVVRLNNNNVSAVSSLALDQRLIESHKHLIHEVVRIPVKVKTLNTMLKEENISRHIDFISIDTENTELDVLQGIDFGFYQVDFLIIENNFNDPFIENYLRTKKFKKIHRLAVNDFYVNLEYLNRWIHQTFEIVNATYYSNEQDPTKNGNATDLVKLLAQKYATAKADGSPLVSNDLFTDTQVGVPKHLFINIQDTVTKALHKYVFYENTPLDFNFIFENLKTYVPVLPPSPPLDILHERINASIGEIVDKHSILEIKSTKITDATKLTDVRREMGVLSPTVGLIEKKHLYRMLVYINTLIWEDTDEVKALLQNYDETNFEQVTKNATISNNIFANNQKRFRIKKMLNDMYSSEVKEHKSYAEEACYLQISSINEIYCKIPEINYLSICYDVVYLDVQYKKVFEQLFEGYPFASLEDTGAWEGVTQQLDEYMVAGFHNTLVRDAFDFDPITYVAGGKLGDFLNQFSVVCEKYYSTGKKGVVYISGSIGDPFVFGVEATYRDTCPILSAQPYLKEYKIHQGEKTNVDLSSWRNNLVLRNWCDMYQSVFGVEWATHPWIAPPNLELTHDFSGKILINTTPYRFPSAGAIQQLRERIGSQLQHCVFVSNEEEHYHHFMQHSGLPMAYCKPTSFNELVSIIDKSKDCYFGFSSCAVIANALHKPHTLLGTDCGFDCVLNTMTGRVPHVLGMFL